MLILEINKTVLKVVTIRHWIVVSPRVSGPASSSRVSVTDKFSCYALLAEHNLSARASMLEGNMSTGRDRMAKGNLLHIAEKIGAVIEKASAVKERTRSIVFCCKFFRNPEKLGST